MPYKINPHRFRRIELKNYATYCHKHPKDCNIYAEGLRIGYQIPEEMHTEGNIVKYKGQLARIYKVHKDGVELLYLSDEKEGIFGKTNKPVFISESRYEKEAQPYVVIAT